MFKKHEYFFHWQFFPSVVILFYFIFLFTNSVCSLNKTFFMLHAVLSGMYDLHIYRTYSTLKVPKREIFDRSDFPDLYTMKSLRVGDFGVKIKNNY